MRRYTKLFGEMVPAEDGRWVKYEDVLTAIKDEEAKKEFAKKFASDWVSVGTE